MSMLLKNTLHGSSYSYLQQLHGQTNLIRPTDTLASHLVEVIVPERNQFLTMCALDGVCK